MAQGIRAAFAASVLFGVVSMVGCSGGSGSGDGSSQSPARRYLDSYAEIYCTTVKPCCDAAGEAHDVDGCLLLLRLFSSEAAQAKHFDQAAADQCLAELQPALATCDGDEPAVCDRVFSGDQAPGAPCNDDIDCQRPAGGDVTCDYDFETESGKCKILVAPAEGQPCDSGSSDTEYYQCTLDPGFYCDASSTCKQRAPVGSACSSTIECTRDASCDSATNLCVAKQAVGGSCTFATDCIEEAYCDAGGVCQQRKGAGEPCTSFDECVGFCDSDTGTCSGSSFNFCVTSN